MLQEGSVTPTSRNLAVQKARADSLLGFGRPAIPALSRHLDIGCSTGILLEKFQESYRNQAVGVEPGEAHRTRAQEAGLTVYPSLEELQQSGEAQFDLVSLSHVLEHLPDPVGYLTHLREYVLTPDGWLLVEVPNLYAHDCFEVAHLFAFSRHTLQEVLRQSGFTIRKSEVHGRPNSTILPFYLTVLCRRTPAKLKIAPLRPERGVWFKRRLGMMRRRILSRLFPRQAWLEPKE